MPSRKTTDRILPLLLLMGVFAVCFSPFLFGNRVLAPLDIVSEMYQPWRGEKSMPRVHNHFVTDAVTQYIPYRLFLHESFRTESFVGWNPFIFGGTAQGANTMLISNEMAIQLHRFLDFWSAWTLGRLFQFLVAGSGMFIFLQSRGCVEGISVLGAVAYMLNQQFVAWIYFNQIVAAFCWAPWILWVLFLAREKSFRFTALAALFIALALLGATLQQVAFLLAALACLFFGWVIEDSAKPSLQVRSAAIVLVAGSVGAGLAAFSLEPNIMAFIENSEASHHRGVLGYEGGSFTPILNLIGSPMSAYPFLLGSVQSLDLWKIFRLSLFDIGFFGTLPMLVACFSLFSRKVPLAAKFMMVSGIVIPLTPLVGYLYHRFNILWILGGCWAACSWLSATDEHKLQSWVHPWRRPFAAFFGIWSLASLTSFANREWLGPWLGEKVQAAASQSQFGFLSDWMQVRAARLIDYLYVWNPWQLLGLGGLLLSCWGLGRIKKNHPAAFVCALGVFAQLSVFWWQWTTWSQPQLPYGTTALEKFLQKEVGASGRLACDTEAAEKHFFPANTLMPAGIAVTEGYDAMHPHGLRSPTGQKWDFPGTTHFLGKLSRPSPQAWDLIWQDGKWGLWRNPTPAAGRFFSGSASLPETLSLDRLRRPTPNTIEVTLPAGARDVEIYSNWHRGWLWQISGSEHWEQALLGANRSLKVVLPDASGHEEKINFRYDPSPSPWVMAISAGSAGLMLFWLCFSTRFFSSARQK